MKLQRPVDRDQIASNLLAVYMNEKTQNEAVKIIYGSSKVNLGPIIRATQKLKNEGFITVTVGRDLRSPLIRTKTDALFEYINRSLINRSNRSVKKSERNLDEREKLFVKALLDSMWFRSIFDFSRVRRLLKRNITNTSVMYPILDNCNLNCDRLDIHTGGAILESIDTMFAMYCAFYSYPLIKNYLDDITLTMLYPEPTKNFDTASATITARFDGVIKGIIEGVSTDYKYWQGLSSSKPLMDSMKMYTSGLKLFCVPPDIAWKLYGIGRVELTIYNITEMAIQDFLYRKLKN